MICAAFTACSKGDEPAAPNGSGQLNISDTPAADNLLQNDNNTSAEADPTGTEDEASTSEETENETNAPENTEDETSAAEETSGEDTAPDTSPNGTDRTETAIIPENNGAQTGTSSAVADLAKAQEGKPFYFGGADPNQGFDNSGLIYYVLNQNGISCPRLTGDIAAMDSKIGYDEIKAGDLVFFEMNGSGKADFGGIYIGEGKMVIAMSEEYPVRIVDITTNYYRDTFQYGIKLL